MKKLLPIAGLVLLATACTEKGLVVTPRVKGGDTTFTATPEVALPRTVVLEEFTGVTCPNCPVGHATVASLQTQFPGRVLAVSYYEKISPQANPVHGKTVQDFRTDDATDISATIFGGVTGLPSAGIDRVAGNNGILVFSPVWAGAVAARMGVQAPANVKVTSEWSEGDRTAIIRVRVAYTSAVSRKQALTLLLTENDIVDAQECVDTISQNPQGPLVIENYNFKHVLRDIITPVTGEPMLNNFAVKEIGRVYERTFVYPVSDKWKADKCALIAIVHNTDGADKEVVQAAEAKLVE